MLTATLSPLRPHMKTSHMLLQGNFKESQKYPFFFDLLAQKILLLCSYCFHVTMAGKKHKMQSHAQQCLHQKTEWVGGRRGSKVRAVHGPKGSNGDISGSSVTPIWELEGFWTIALLLQPTDHTRLRRIGTILRLFFLSESGNLILSTNFRTVEKNPLPKDVPSFRAGISFILIINVPENPWHIDHSEAPQSPQGDPIIAVTSMIPPPTSRGR